MEKLPDAIHIAPFTCRPRAASRRIAALARDLVDASVVLAGARARHGPVLASAGYVGGRSA
jgi:hypothetical protein